MSQGVFARLLNVSVKTVQSWEQGERKPSHAALRLLQVLAEQPEMVCQIVGLGRKAGAEPPTGGPVAASEAPAPAERGKRKGKRRG
jgi:hypothetical protein